MVKKLKITNRKTKKFREYISVNKWIVNDNIDKKAPVFVNEIESNYTSHFNTSALGHGVQGIVYFDDGDIEIKNELNPMLVEAVGEFGHRYFIPMHGNKFSIYDGLCSANFKLKEDTEYIFKIKLMDFSGNKSEEINELKFKTENNHKINNF